MADKEQFETLQGLAGEDNPRGDWSGKPAVPATNVAAKNSSGHHMFVEVNLNGATATAVKVDGVTVGARTSGLFFVREDSTIAIVYSAGSPTWQWFYAN